MMTRGNAEALSLINDIGTLESGTSADICILDAKTTPRMALRMETTSDISEELFVLQTMGDDRAVAAVYVFGKSCKPH